MQYSALLLSGIVFNSTGVHGLLYAIQGAIGWRARTFIWLYCWGLFMRLLFNQVRGFVHAFVMIIMLLKIMKRISRELLIFDPKYFLLTYLNIKFLWRIFVQKVPIKNLNTGLSINYCWWWQSLNLKYRIRWQFITDLYLNFPQNVTVKKANHK